MATTTAPKPKRRAPAKPARRTPDTKELKRHLEGSVERIERSIDAAEAAAKDLRTGTEKGSRDLVRDLERTLRNAKTNARRVGRAMAKDIDRARGAGTKTKAAGRA